MEIVRIESLAEVTCSNVYYELNGKFYGTCSACGKPVELDHHLTAIDLKHEDMGERHSFCDEECEKRWFLANYPSVADAYTAGECDRADKFMKMDLKYEWHQVIEVHHQTGVKTYECESFWDHACNYGGLGAVEYHSLDEAELDWWRDLPVELAELLKKGPVIELMHGDGVKYEPLAGFNKEEYGLGILGEDLHMLIRIDSEEEAREIAENYKGHEWIAVRAAARGIIRSQREEYVRNF